MKSPAPTITLLCLLFLASCITRNNTSLEAFNQDVYTPEYASGFKILGAENAASTLIQITNPWQGANDVTMSYFVTRNGEQAPAGFNGPVIPAGAKQIVCMSSSYVAMLDELGEVNRIVGVSGIDYIANPSNVTYVALLFFSSLPTGFPSTSSVLVTSSTSSCI